MKKNIIIPIVFLIVVMGAILIGLSLKNNKEVRGNKISVVTTLFPLYDFAKEIGGDKVQVSLLLPPGVEAHAFEPKPSDIVKINGSDLFVYTGKFMEPWAEDIINGITNKNIEVVDSSAGIELMKKESHEKEREHTDIHKEEHKDAHLEEHSHDYHGGVDPHIWLDFNNAKIMAENITKSLIEVDPQNTEYYQNNLKSYKDKIGYLDNEYKNTLTTCKSKTIIYGGHYAFGYLAKRYGFEYLSAQGFSPDSEPTAKDIVALVEQIKKNNINYIFYEELTSPKIAETLAKETSTKLLLLHGAHNLAKEDYKKNVSFISIMKENLANLKIGLICN